MGCVVLELGSAMFKVACVGGVGSIPGFPGILALGLCLGATDVVAVSIDNCFPPVICRLQFITCTFLKGD